MKKHTKIKLRNPIALLLRKRQYQLKIVKSKKKKLIEKLFDKMKYDIE
jgi:hypothetical protein